ncbi:MAG: hypothetical protein HZB51_11510 [Chloroflexi bacterium]|nr:hypothetical protein [Chloroflexota bacterium]
MLKYWRWSQVGHCQNLSPNFPPSPEVAPQLITRSVQRQIKKPRFTPSDQLLLVLLATRVQQWKDTLLVLKSNTLLWWHRLVSAYFGSSNLANAADEFFGWFGMHALALSIYDVLEEMIDKNIRQNGEIQLTYAQELVRQREGYYALEMIGDKRFDFGVPRDFVKSIVEFASA